MSRGPGSCRAPPAGTLSDVSGDVIDDLERVVERREEEPEGEDRPVVYPTSLKSERAGSGEKFCPELYSRRSTHRRVWTGQDKEARACVCALWARWECAQGMGEEHLYSRRSTHRRVWTGQDGSELSDDRFTFVNARVISRFEFIKTTTREQSELRMG